MKFEDYLKERFAEEWPGIIDDELNDQFDNWLETKDINDMIEYGNKAMELPEMLS